MLQRARPASRGVKESLAYTRLTVAGREPLKEWNSYRMHRPPRMPMKEAVAMTTVTRIVLVAALFGLLVIGGAYRPAIAAEAQFSLMVGQSVTLGAYTLVFRGVVQRLPAYDLYFGSVLAARFPSSGSSPDPGLYLYADGSVGIVTATVAPNGSAVTGTLTVK